MLLDRFLLAWYVAEQHQTSVQSAHRRVIATLLEMDLRKAPFSRLLLTLRELPWRLAQGNCSSPGLGGTLQETAYAWVSSAWAGWRAGRWFWVWCPDLGGSTPTSSA